MICYNTSQSPLAPPSFYNFTRVGQLNRLRTTLQQSCSTRSHKINEQAHLEAIHCSVSSTSNQFKMSLRNLLNRRNGLRGSLIECDHNANNDSAVASHGRRETVEFDWETLDDNNAEVGWDNFDWNSLIVELGKISSIKQGSRQLVLGLAQLPPEFSSGYVLHDAIRIGAPDDVLMFICERFPETLRQENSLGQFPSHVACSSGSSPEFIAHCINMCPQSVAVKDDAGKTPVHHLCSGYHQGDTVSRATIRKMKQILWMLFRKAPASVVGGDNRGLGPIELALESNLGMEFVSTLQDLTARYHENEARKAAQRRCMNTRRQMEKAHSPHAAYAA